MAACERARGGRRHHTTNVEHQRTAFNVQRPILYMCRQAKKSSAMQELLPHHGFHEVDKGHFFAGMFSGQQTQACIPGGPFIGVHRGETSPYLTHAAVLRIFSFASAMPSQSPRPSPDMSPTSLLLRRPSYDREAGTSSCQPETGVQTGDTAGTPVDGVARFDGVSTIAFTERGLLYAIC